MEKKIYLASASPRRRELLLQLGMEFEICVSHAREVCKSREPSEMVKELSALKAEAVFEGLSDQQKEEALVIGADTVVALEDRIMGKPADQRQAEEMLSLLQGRTHQVYTGVTLIRQEKGVRKERSFFECTEVSMFPMTEEEIRAYVATGEPVDKAGAYGIQGKCAAFIKGISGDYNNVVGLPIGRLYQEMKQWKE